MIAPDTSRAPTVLAYIPSPPQGVWYLGDFPLRGFQDHSLFI